MAEVCSSLLTFLKVNEIGDEGKKIVAWSDSCGGQNKNKKNFQMICFGSRLLGSLYRPKCFKYLYLNLP